MPQLCLKADSISFDMDNEDPMINSVQSFTGKREIFLQIPEDPSFKALSCYLTEKDAAFTSPYYASSWSEIPSQSYFVLVREAKGYASYFCLSHQNILVSLSGTQGGMILHLASDQPSETEKLINVLICLHGIKLHELLQKTMRLALSLTGGLGRSIEEKLSSPPWLGGLGWESGIAMGAQVSHEKVVAAVKSLIQAGLPPSFVVIDEGWQHLEKTAEDYHALASFEADPKRFPNGVKGLVDDLHSLGIREIGMWHGMMGSRGGIHPCLAQVYNLVASEDGCYFLGNDLGRTFQFFHDYYGYLRTRGISFVKVGDQSTVHRYSGNEQVCVLHKHLQTALQAAASVQFNGAHFNTECLRNENLFYWGNSRFARAAGDIDASNPAGRMRAIRDNLTNALWLQHLMQVDFDAWLTNTEQSEALAIFHALSGSINVIGDLAGEHGKALINKFLMPCGHLLKADRPLTLCEDSIFCNPLVEKKIYKAFTFKGEHGILGVFNLTSGKRTLHGQVSPRDVEGLQGERFALFSHHNGFVKLVKPNESVDITLKPNQNDVLIFAPVHQGIAVLGCSSFFLAPGPLLEVNIDDDSIHISTLMATRLLVYCERQILEVRRNGKVVPWEYDYRRHTLSIDSRARNLSGHASYNIIFEK